MAKRPSPDAVIDLTSDSEEQESRLGDVTRRLYSNNNGGGLKTKRVRTNPTSASDEEVEVVEAPRTSPLAAPNHNAGNNADDELQIVGTINELKLPHPRQYCTAHPFTTKAATSGQLRIQNERHCELCYCYVCDAPVKDCKSWANADGVWQNSHCNATDKQNWWVKERQAAKSGKTSKGVGSQRPLAVSARQNSNRSPTTAGNSTTNTSVARGSSNGSNATGSSIATVAGENTQRAASTTNASRNVSIARDPSDHSNSLELSIAARNMYAPNKCTHCGWDCNTESMEKVKWRCLKCGQLTRPPEQQSTTRQIRQQGYDLGVRKIGFSIIVGLRREKASKAACQEYDKAAAKNAIFHSSLGRSPSPHRILRLVGQWDEEKLRECEEDAIALDNQDDIALLRVLNRVNVGNDNNTIFYRKGVAQVYRGGVTATWDAATETGAFTISLSLEKNCTSSFQRNSDSALVLGCWFKIFPLTLGSISGTLKASSPKYDKFHHPPSPAVKDAFDATVSSFNKKADEFRSSLTLTSGCSNGDIGGYTNGDISSKGILERFYREHFPYSDFASTNIFASDDWNKLSNHRRAYHDHTRDHDFILNHADRRFAALCLKKTSASSKSVSGDTTQDLMAHLENLGHEPELSCEGLTVELLEFQKQSLRWAMEKETIPGGIQSYFWVKVPIEDSNLYFNPVLGRFREGKPKVVRGGIIAEEMGLGKTIISLALILKHPAPELPVSGSHISSLANAPATTTVGLDSNGLQWNPDLYSQTSVGSKLRGSVLSRGTLVICPVSLVGQWIEEAKSKLSNPGLLYPYHGGNRIRDAKKLAENAIVVTTYQVLASDDSYHRKKSPNPSEYCPPLEQVRWWRIICDEGHSLRQGSTQKNRSLSQLVADNKWMVTGTPVSTSMLDLKSQLKLIGVEDVDAMFQNPQKYAGRRKGPNLATPGNLRFLLRNIMIRHTQKQVYRGTNTTLMSLPPKIERSIQVALSDPERKEYDALDQAARDFYVKFKASHSDELSKHYLLLSQKLTPQRVACSGGHPPLNPEAAGTVEDDDDNEDGTKSRKKKEVKLSEFCFKSKLMVLIKELKQARDSDPTSKSLVFSHFNMTLDWLKQELPNHGFQFRTLSGSMTMKQRAKALHDFQSDPPTTIFLLSMRSGNCGINLTQANRVFLMEPGFNPALEKQAIGRVHRLGQKRNVEIIRLFVKDSVETRICKFLEMKYGAPGDSSKEGPEKNANESVSGEVENEAFEAVGNLASERPKNKMVTSEFDMLFGVESEIKKMDATLQDVAVPDAVISKYEDMDFSTADVAIPDAAISSDYL